MLFMQLKNADLVNSLLLSKMGSRTGTSPLQNIQSLNCNKDYQNSLETARKWIFKNATTNSTFNFLTVIATVVEVWLL